MTIFVEKGEDLRALGRLPVVDADRGQSIPKYREPTQFIWRHRNHVSKSSTILNPSPPFAARLSQVTPRSLFFNADAKSPALASGDNLGLLFELRPPNTKSWNCSALAGDVLEGFERLTYLFYGDQCVDRQGAITSTRPMIGRASLYWQWLRHQQAREIDSVLVRHEPQKAYEWPLRARFVGA